MSSLSPQAYRETSLAKGELKCHPRWNCWNSHRSLPSLQIPLNRQSFRRSRQRRLDAWSRQEHGEGTRETKVPQLGRAAARERQAASASNGNKVLQVEPTNNRDRNLNVDEAAEMLGMKKSWLYRHSGRLPFTRRLSRRAIRFSEKGIRRWLETRNNGGSVKGDQRRIKG